MTRRRPAALRRMQLPVVAVALLAACGQLGGLTHLWLVPHELCAEHGAVVHAEHAHAQTRPAPLTASRDPHAADAAGLSFSAASSSDAHDPHDAHCDSYFSRRDCVLIEAPRALVDVATIASHVGARLAARLEPRVSVFAYAPKSSPPAPPV
jgi:hypothetical protein